MKNKILLLILTVCMSASGFAQTVWDPAGNAAATGNWNEAASWTNGLPNADNKAVFNVDPAVVATVTDTQEGFQLMVGDGGPGAIVIEDGGSIITAAVWAGVGHNNTATIEVKTGGLLSFGEHAWIGHVDGGDGTITVNGGTVIVNAMLGLGWNGGTGKLTMNSGSYKGGGFGDGSIKDGSLLEIAEGASVKFAGNVSGQANLFIEAGKIVALGGGDMGAYFDGDSTVIVKMGEPGGQAVWTGVVSTDWQVFANWSSNAVPTIDSKTVFNVPGAQKAVISEAAFVGKLVAGDQGDPEVATQDTIVVANEGVLTISKDGGWSSVGWNSDALMIVEEGGSVEFQNHLWLGWNANVGTIEINGGSVSVAGMYGTDFEHDVEGERDWGQGHVFVNAGSLHLDQFRLDDDTAEGGEDLVDELEQKFQSIPPGSFIDVFGGQVTMNGDQTIKVNRYVEAGRITANQGLGTLIVVFDATLGPEDVNTGEPIGMTMISAAPEFVATYPMDAAVDVSRDTTIVITFSKLMDQASVEGAITIAPELANQAFAWEGSVLTISGDLEDGITYSVSVGVEALDAAGNAFAGEETFSFRVEGEIVMATNNRGLNYISMYPNPAQDKISFGNKVVADLKIYSASGQLMMTKSNVKEINIQQLKSGHYLVKAIIENESVVRRLVVK